MRITFLAYVVVTAVAFYETAHGSRQMWRRGGGHTQLGFRLSFIDRHTLDLSKDFSFKALDMETTTGLHARAGGKTS